MRPANDGPNPASLFAALALRRASHVTLAGPRFGLPLIILRACGPGDPHLHYYLTNCDDTLGPQEMTEL